MSDEQGTEAWQSARCGKVTASRLADVLAKTKTGNSASRTNYMTQLVLERITQTRAESYSNAAMQWGTEQEPFARAAYEAHTGQMVEEVGFIPHPDIDATFRNFADCTWVQGYGRPEPLWERVAGYVLAFAIGVGMAVLLVAWWTA